MPGFIRQIKTFLKWVEERRESHQEGLGVSAIWQKHLIALKKTIKDVGEKLAKCCLSFGDTGNAAKLTETWCFDIEKSRLKSILNSILAWPHGCLWIPLH